MIKAFNKNVRRQVYQVGDLVIKRIILPKDDPRGKWTPTYEGPFVIKSMFSGGAMILTVAPKNFPSHISQNMARKISKWLKVAQELDNQIISSGNQPQIRVLCCIKVLASK